jgi:hypothetical protein
LVTCFATQEGIASAAPVSSPVKVGRHADQFGEAGVEGVQRRAANHEADLKGGLCAEASLEPATGYIDLCSPALQMDDQVPAANFAGSDNGVGAPRPLATRIA